ncbi:MAG TPA: hypothetical protein VM784_02555 [Actinomycetota bacterium]|nr:hypothetical protein [Actinomycetota bacterium]
MRPRENSIEIGIKARLLILGASVLLIFGAGAGIADAHHKSWHENGGGKSAAAKAKPKPTKPSKPLKDSDSKHPSGKSREQNPGPADDEQGKSPSDPDGMENGGADKPGGSGGVDLDDQDGNNGCGNDNDFEDDNRGNCGGPAVAKQKTKKCPDMAAVARNRGKKLGLARRGCAIEPVSLRLSGTVAGGASDVGGTTEDTSDVLGTVVTRRERAVEDAADTAAVLGETLSRPAPETAADEPVLGTGQGRGATVLGVPLAVTGAAAALWSILALGLIGAGFLLLRLRGRAS